MYADKVSQLTVGQSYSYCVSAVSREYMINTKTLDGSFVKRSKPACVDHIVNWESSATVRVTLSKNAGSLPVEGTLIAWELVYVDGDGEETRLLHNTTETPQNGLVKIPLKVDPSQYSDLGIMDVTNLALKVHTSKESVSEQDDAVIYHTYLCDFETIDCPGSGLPPPDEFKYNSGRRRLQNSPAHKVVSPEGTGRRLNSLPILHSGGNDFDFELAGNSYCQDPTGRAYKSTSTVIANGPTPDPAFKDAWV
ncbi:hypothetical protein THAOC_07935, partial [Thalassiosira oceanica]